MMANDENFDKSGVIDSRARLEADIDAYGERNYIISRAKIHEWLDRQAAITERDVRTEKEKVWCDCDCCGWQEQRVQLHDLVRSMFYKYVEFADGEGSAYLPREEFGKAMRMIGVDVPLHRYEIYGLLDGDRYMLEAAYESGFFGEVSKDDQLDDGV